MKEDKIFEGVENIGESDKDTAAKNEDCGDKVENENFGFAVNLNGCTKKSKKQKIWNSIFYVCLAAIIFFVGFFSFLLFNRDIWALSWAIKQAEDENYWGYSKEELINGAGEGFTSGLLDIYSQFLTPSEIDGYYDGRAGVSTSFGINTSIGSMKVSGEISGVFVTTVQNGSEASSLGVQTMSKVVKVGGTNFTGTSIAELTSLLDSKSKPLTIVFKPVIANENGVLVYGEQTEKTFTGDGNGEGDYFGMSFSYASLASFKPISGAFVVRVIYGSNAQKSGLKPYDKFFKYKKASGEEGLFSDLTYEEMGDMISELIETGGYAQFNEIYNDNGVLRERLKTVEGTEDNYICMAKTRYSTTNVMYIDSENPNGIDGLMIPDLKDGNMNLPSNTAYIKLGSFSGNSVNEFDAAMNQYKQNGKSKMILDLRGNGGGSIDILSAIASYLIPDASERRVIITENFRNGNKKNVYTDRVFPKETYKIDKLIVLTDSNTASASEGLLSCLMDYYEFTYDNNQSKLEIVGRTTYGKDLVQTTYKFPFGDYAVKFTTARYFSAGGDEISAGNYDGTKGINPSKGCMVESNLMNFPYLYSEDADIQKAISML